MRNTAFIICEYNPFHNGHMYHIEKTRENGANTLICIMSGNFVQRGDIAFCDKNIRAKSAVDHGADLVLELPVKYVLSGANHFAFGAMEIIKETGMSGTLSFGASAPLEDLFRLAKRSESPETAKAVAALSREKGITYAAAFQKTLAEIEPDRSELLSDPNNILALEYIKAANKEKADLEYFSLQRTVLHDSEDIQGKYAGAKYIRDVVYKTGNLTDVQTYLPEDVYHTLLQGWIHGDLPSSKTHFSAAAMARLISLQASDFAQINGVNMGIENRILRCLMNSSDIYTLFDSVKTKRFTHARIRQILLSAAFGIKKTALDRKQPYIRVLGMNEKGKACIKAIRKHSSVPVIMNISEAPDCEEKELDALCGKIFDMCRPSPKHKAPEYAVKPYVL